MFESLSKYSAIVRTHYQVSGLSRFLGWWAGELRSLIPAPMMRWLEVPTEKLLITSTDREWLFWRSGNGGVQLLDRLIVDTDPEQSRDRLQACLDSFHDTLTAVIYCLPADQVLCKRLHLPVAAETNLRQAVGFEMDRQTPFNVNEVYFDVKVVQRNAPFIDVDMYVVPRHDLEGRLQQLARMGLNLQGVDIDLISNVGESEQHQPLPLHINMLPRNKRSKRKNRSVRVNWALTSAAMLLLAFLMAESLYLRNNTLGQLQRQRDSLRSEAVQVKKLELQLDKAIGAANFLSEQQSRTPMALDVIAEVTNLLPKHTWIQRMQTKGTELELTGLSDSSQQMIRLLNASPMFHSASFKGAISTDRRLNKDHFSATARIDPSSSFAGNQVSENDSVVGERATKNLEDKQLIEKDDSAITKEKGGVTDNAVRLVPESRS